MKLADLPQVRALSAREKLLLVDELWEDVAQEVAELGITTAEKEILDERWTAFMRDPSSALTLDQFKKKVESLRE
jgi:putative addiction module component (TIGR02574 family)